MSELKPCPFCGGTDIEYHYQGSSDWSFECNGCPVHASFWVRLKKDEDWDEVKEGDETGEHARAIQYWNTRAEKPNKHPETSTGYAVGAEIINDDYPTQNTETGQRMFGDKGYPQPPALTPTKTP